jgi:hypothetical protein
MERTTKVKKSGSKKPSAEGAQSKAMNPTKQSTGSKKKGGSTRTTAESEFPRGGYQVDLEEKIRERAHQIFLKNGGSPGSDMENWLQAEREIYEENGG